MQEDILEHLKQTYQPDAIILHGSRARGRERAHSDWDFIFLYRDLKDTHDGREVYRKENIEFSSHLFSIAVGELENEFSTKLQGAKVLYEKDGEGTDLLNEASTIYQKGVHWSPKKISNHKLWMQGRIDGMSDNIDNPVIFSKYFTDFYQRIFNYWYWILQNSYSQPIYIAAEEIGEKDSGYYELVSRLIETSTSVEEKIKIAEEIRDQLFLEKS